MSKVRFVVIHIEDEPWNYSFVMLGLREVILERLHGELAKCRLEMAERGPEDFPSCSKLSWELSGKQFEIAYWLAETVGQISDETSEIFKDLTKANAYIIDVMRPGINGGWHSIWRRTLKAIMPHVRNVDGQVRLYTAFDIEAILDADKIDMTLNDELRQLGLPPIVEKSGDFSELLDFILSQCDGVFSK